MNYEVIYANLIESRQDRTLDPDEYYEKHHIGPKSLDGPDEKGNIVHLTAREHFIAHGLLYRICEGDDKRKMAYAFFRMCGSSKKGKRVFGRKYEIARKVFSESISGENNHNKKLENREKISNSLKGRPALNKGVPAGNRGLKMPEMSGENHPMHGKTHSEETKSKISESLKGKIPGNKGKSWDEETRKKISENGKGKIPGNKGKEWKMITCEKCGKEVSPPMYKRGHGENCGKNTKKYRVFDPEGNEYITEEGIVEFCKKNGLTANNMICVAKGKRKHHKGWTIEEI